MDAYARQLVKIAQHACEIGGIEACRARQCALSAVSAHYLDRAERAAESSQWGDTQHQRQQRQAEARRLQAVADQLRQEREGVA